MYSHSTLYQDRVSLSSVILALQGVPKSGFGIPNVKKGLDKGVFLCYIIYVVLHINHIGIKHSYNIKISLDNAL